MQGLRRNGNVPTANERNSSYTNFADVLALNDGRTRNDILGRDHPEGHGPRSRHHPICCGGRRRSGIRDSRIAPGHGWVCARSVRYTSCASANQTLPLQLRRPEPASRQSHRSRTPSTILNLYPAPNSGLRPTATARPCLSTATQFDARGDYNPNDKEQIFGRFSFSDDPIFIPGIFSGVADGGAFQQGDQTARSHQMVAAYTHVFNPNVVNQVRGGFAHLHTTRFGPEAPPSGIPEKYGIQGIPQSHQITAACPAFGSITWPRLGSNPYLPSDEVSQTLQVTDDFTRIYGMHSFKMGVEFQNAKFSTLQPAGRTATSTTAASTPTFRTRARPTAASLSCCCRQPRRAPSAACQSQSQGGFSYSGGSNGVTPPTSTRPTTKELFCYLLPGRLEDDSEDDPEPWSSLGLLRPHQGNKWRPGELRSLSHSVQGLGEPTFLVPASGKANRTLSTATPYTNAAGTTHSRFRRNMRRDRLLRVAGSACQGWNHSVTDRQVRQGLLQTRKATSLLVSASPIRSTPNWSDAADLACSSTRLKTRDTGRTSARTILSCSTCPTSRDQSRFRHLFAGGAHHVQFAVCGLPDRGTRGNRILRIRLLVHSARA